MTIDITHEDRLMIIGLLNKELRYICNSGDALKDALPMTYEERRRTDRIYLIRDALSQNDTITINIL